MVNKKSQSFSNQSNTKNQDTHYSDQYSKNNKGVSHDNNDDLGFNANFIVKNEMINKQIKVNMGNIQNQVIDLMVSCRAQQKIGLIRYEDEVHFKVDKEIDWQRYKINIYALGSQLYSKVHINSKGLMGLGGFWEKKYHLLDQQLRLNEWVLWDKDSDGGDLGNLSIEIKLWKNTH